jgi:hypothetical protein
MHTGSCGAAKRNETMAGGGGDLDLFLVLFILLLKCQFTIYLTV